MKRRGFAGPEPDGLERIVTRDLRPVTRRGVNRALALASVSAGVLPWSLAEAAPVDSFGQAEWVQKYDTDPSQAVQRTTTPILSQLTVSASEQAIAAYQDIVSKGGWPMVPPSQTLKIGSNGPAVVKLRQRLIASGDLGPGTGTSTVFDSYVESAVRRFQARHGIGMTGVVAQQTFDALNVPAETRLRQLEVNLVRLRSFATGNLGPRYVTLNIPAAEVETVEGDTVMTHHIAGVGKIDRQSPVMQTRALDINFNPFWTVPASIIRKDLIPKMQADANYLTDNHIRVINKEGQEVPPTAINWNSLDATNYKFRQDPGGDVNSLGFVRINIANPYGVYMHDTPSKGIFGDDFRFVSSGCVRVQNVRDYVAWLLKDNPGWDRDHIDDTIRSGERVDVKIASPVNVYWVYITAWANDGLVQFREDIYKRDGFSDGAVASAAAPGRPQQGNLQPVSTGSRGGQVLQPMISPDDE